MLQKLNAARKNHMNSFQLLERLVAFPTISRDSNLDLIEFTRWFLTENGAECRLVHNEDHNKANLFASIGPKEKPGVMLSGHTDVVPVDGQRWASDPFHLSQSSDLLFGRGTTDMKGFLACALNAAALASTKRLATPLWLAFSYDEEIGCVGVRRLIDVMTADGMKPLCCVVGEPTSMQVATGHKGKTALQAACTGRAAHTAFAPNALNALHLACDFVGILRDLQCQLEADGASDSDFEVPFTTVHAAKISGGVAANIVPADATVDFEIRNLQEDNPADLIQTLRDSAARIAANAKKSAPEADISIHVTNSYPGLSTNPNETIVPFVQSLANGNSVTKVAFGTEAGLFSERLGTPTVICGPGSMDQGHKPDEFISRQQMELCDAMLSALVDRLVEGMPPVS